jgi:hypothetical protein
MTSAGILDRGAWGGGLAYVGLQPPQMPPPIVLRAAIALPSGGASFSHVDDIQYPFNVGESVYVLDVEYLVHNFVNDEIVIANINKAGAWVYKDVKQDVLWLPVDAMAPFLRTLVSLFAIFFGNVRGTVHTCTCSDMQAYTHFRFGTDFRRSSNMPISNGGHPEENDSKLFPNCKTNTRSQKPI